MTDPVTKPLPLKGGKPIEPKSAPAITVQFFLKHGAIVQWPVPASEPFALPGLISSIRACGYFLAPDFYIPADEIACIGIAQAGIPPAARIHQSQHPTRQ